MHAPGGYTLLELLVVLAIVGGLVAVAAPRTIRMWDSTRIGLIQDDIERQLFDLPTRVRLSGHAGYLSSQEKLPDSEPTPDQLRPRLPYDGSGSVEAWQKLELHLPDHWQMQTAKPVYFHFSGACDGGEVSFAGEGLELRYRLTAPACRPVLETGNAS
jgi:prepilin-type N-terminal cleavage/methylation domain-containing protein